MLAALAELGALDAVVESLGNPNNYFLRYNAANLLFQAKAHYATTVPQIAGLLKAKDREVRAGAAGLLGRIGPDAPRRYRHWTRCGTTRSRQYASRSRRR